MLSSWFENFPSWLIVRLLVYSVRSVCTVAKVYQKNTEKTTPQAQSNFFLKS